MNSEDNIIIAASGIGRCAHEILQNETSAALWGGTSKGLFLVTDSKKVLFISKESYQGPLTINLSGEKLLHETFPSETHFMLSPGEIKHIPSGMKIKIQPQIPIWVPIVNDLKDHELEAFVIRIKEIESLLMDHISDQKLDLIPSNHGLENISDLLKLKNALVSIFSAQNKAAVYDSLSGLLGSGGGLTPTGDDIVCGFLLAAHAWVEILAPNFKLKETINQIVKTAWKKTTAISANLITCAASGSADERIINSMNWLASGRHSAALIIEELLSYGSSSGLDTLTGILAFIQASPRVIQKL